MNAEERKRLSELMGKTLGGKYKILSLIDRGGMGAVYRARQMNLDRIVAVKVVREEHLFYPNVIEKFMEEARKGSSIQHPNAVEIYDFDHDRDTDRLYLVMKLLEGKTLKRVIQESDTLPWKRTVAIAGQICGVLAEAHEKGIIHRDLKPANIMVESRHGTSWDWITVMDFGIAKVFSEQHGITQTGILMGTPYYMSPEQVEGKGDLDGRSDLYSLGIILYEMLTGKVPFHADSTISVKIKHITEPLPPLRDTTAGQDIPPKLEDIIMRCLEKNRENRFRSAGDLFHALEELQVEKAPLPGQTEPPKILEETRSLKKVSPAALSPPCPACGQPTAEERFTCPRCGRENLCTSHRTGDGPCILCTKQAAPSVLRRTFKRWWKERSSAGSAARRLVPEGWKGKAAILVLLALIAVSGGAVYRLTGGSGSEAVPGNRPLIPESLPAEQVGTETREADPLPVQHARLRGEFLAVPVSGTDGEETASIRVRELPRGATLSLDDRLRAVAPDIVELLEPGWSLLEARKEGYESWIEMVRMEAGTVLLLTVSEEGGAVAGQSITITGEPEGAEIYLDNRFAGTVPTTLDSAEPGWHLVEISEHDHVSWMTDLWLEPGEEIALDIPALEPESEQGWIVLSGAPADAVITLDGTDVSADNMDEPLYVHPGMHRISVSKPGDQPWTETVPVQEGEQVTLQVPPLSSTIRKGRIQVSGEPVGSKIYLDGWFAGRVPKTLSGLKPGWHVLKFKKEGFQDRQEEITLKEGQSVQLSVSLTPVKTFGTLRVTGTSGAHVYIGEKHVATIPQTIENVPSGTHRLRAVLKGYKDHEQNILLEPEHTLDLEIVLKKKKKSFLKKINPF